LVARASEIAQKGLLAADERRWTRISDGKRFVFNLRSSAFIGGQRCVVPFSAASASLHHTAIEMSGTSYQELTYGTHF
jgi:hypothetical protein